MGVITRRSFAARGVAASLLASQAPGFESAYAQDLDLPSDADIRRILADRVDVLSSAQDSIGMVAGVIGPQGRRIVSVGHRDKGDPRELTGDTVFEFGSVAKAFTALLLADMVVRREVSLDDPAARYLPRAVVLPERAGKAITLIDLATHTSGLPFMPDPPADPAQPYGAADIYRFLAGYRLPRDIGGDWEYSNLGYWLLGEALAARARTSFEMLLRERILTPLGLNRTGFALSAQMKADLAVGHDASLGHSPSMLDIPVYRLMRAAGSGFCSTANDALAFLAAAMGRVRSPLAEAFALTVNTSRPVPGSTDAQALGWTLIGTGADQLVFRDGGTFGFASCLVWDRARRVGAVALANCITDVSDVARHILRPDYPLAKLAPITHREVPLAAAVLDRYVGRYQAQGEGIFTVALDGDHLTFEAPSDWGLPKLRIRPESRLSFFAAELPWRVTFQLSPEGSVAGVLIYPPRGQGGISARRVP